MAMLERMPEGTARSSAPRGALPGSLTGGLLCALILWTLLGNTLVCAVVLRFRRLRARVTNLFIASLAASDLLLAVLVMPWKAAAEVVGFWPFGGFCKVWVALDITCSTASILNLCMISVDRYCALSSPFRYQREMTARAACVLIGGAWALAVLVSALPVQMDWHRDVGDLSGDATICDSSLSREYAIGSSLVSFYIPVTIILITYARIYRIAQAQIRRIVSLERAADRLAAQRHRRLRTTLRRETRVLKTLSLIVGAFVCCWLPFFILNCALPFCRSSAHPPPGLPCVSDATFNVFVWFGWSNSALNPAIYAFNSEFRAGFSRLLRCRADTCTPLEMLNLTHERASVRRPSARGSIVPSAEEQMLPRTPQCSFGPCTAPAHIGPEQEREGGVQVEERSDPAYEHLCPTTAGTDSSPEPSGREQIHCR